MQSCRSLEKVSSSDEQDDDSRNTVRTADMDHCPGHLDVLEPVVSADRVHDPSPADCDIRDRPGRTGLRPRQLDTGPARAGQMHPLQDRHEPAALLRGERNRAWQPFFPIFSPFLGHFLLPQGIPSLACQLRGRESPTRVANRDQCSGEKL